MEVGGPSPARIAHADWGSTPAKRWIAIAERTSRGCYRARPPERVVDSSAVISALRAEAGSGQALLVGFDFPIGLPAGYAERAGIEDFLDLLPRLGRDEWSEFYSVATRRDEICLRRPFYPARPGGARREDLVRGLGLQSTDDLLRRCEHGNAQRRPACPLFWTLGPQQAGKAAIHGWRNVLAPAVSSGAAIWPFSGELVDLLRTGRSVVTETYPAELYRRLGVDFRGSKRVQENRRAAGESLLIRAEQSKIEVAPELRAGLLAGFGPSSAAEDPFDAVVGLFGMIEIVSGSCRFEEPPDGVLRRVEGWILGALQRAIDSRTFTEPKAQP